MADTEYSDREFENIRKLIHEDKQIALKNFQASRMESNIRGKIKSIKAQNKGFRITVKKTAYALPAILALLGLGLLYIVIGPGNRDSIKKNIFEADEISMAVETDLQHTLHSIHGNSIHFDNFEQNLYQMLNEDRLSDSDYGTSPAQSNKIFFNIVKQELTRIRCQDGYYNFFKDILIYIKEDSDA